MSGKDAEQLSIVECNFYEAHWWREYNLHRQLHAFDKVPEIHVLGADGGTPEMV